MMYPLIAQKRSYWCVPACLESILKAESFGVSQEEIANNLGIKENGFNFNRARLTNFTGSYGLYLGFESPFLGAIEDDLILKQINKKHILIAGKFRGKKHCILVLDYNYPSDFAFVYDPSLKRPFQISIPKIKEAINAREDLRNGYYLISS
ncbi:MAG: C39 family peptidase [Candidatus Pacearchaeota archaeon]